MSAKMTRTAGTMTSDHRLARGHDRDLCRTAVIGFAVYAPLSRSRLAALERGGPTDPAYLRARGRARWLDAIVITAALVILGLMVLMRTFL